MIFSDCLIREARALAGSSQADLAAADVAVGLIIRVEAADGMAMARKADLAAIRGVCEDVGLESTARWSECAADGGQGMIGAALRALAAHVNNNESADMWDTRQRLTEEQRSAKSRKIKAVATEIRVLADAS